MTCTGNYFGLCVDGIDINMKHNYVLMGYANDGRRGHLSRYIDSQRVGRSEDLIPVGVQNFRIPTDRSHVRYLLSFLGSKVPMAWG